MGLFCVSENMTEGGVQKGSGKLYRVIQSEDGRCRMYFSPHPHLWFTCHKSFIRYANLQPPHFCLENIPVALQNFCGRVVTVESTPTHLTGGPLAHTELALERVPIQGGAPQKLPFASQDQVVLHQSPMLVK